MKSMGRYSLLLGFDSDDDDSMLIDEFDGFADGDEEMNDSDGDAKNHSNSAELKTTVQDEIMVDVFSNVSVETNYSTVDGDIEMQFSCGETPQQPLRCNHPWFYENLMSSPVYGSPLPNFSENGKFVACLPPSSPSQPDLHQLVPTCTETSMLPKKELHPPRSGDMVKHDKHHNTSVEQPVAKPKPSPVVHLEGFADAVKTNTSWDDPFGEESTNEPSSGGPKPSHSTIIRGKDTVESSSRVYKPPRSMVNCTRDSASQCKEIAKPSYATVTQGKKDAANSGERSKSLHRVNDDAGACKDTFEPSVSMTSRGKGAKVSELCRAFEAKQHQFNKSTGSDAVPVGGNKKEGKHDSQKGVSTSKQRIHPIIAAYNDMSGGVSLQQKHSSKKKDRNDIASTIAPTSFASSKDMAHTPKNEQGRQESSKFHRKETSEEKSLAFKTAMTNAPRQAKKKTSKRSNNVGRTFKSTQGGLFSLREDIETIKNKEMKNKRKDKVTATEQTTKASDETKTSMNAYSTRERVASASSAVAKELPLQSAETPAISQPVITQVCILIDNSKPAVKNLLPLLRMNLEKLWRLASLSSKQEFHFCFLTPDWCSPFASNEDDYKDYSTKATSFEESAQNDGALSDGIIQASHQAKSIRWKPKSQKIAYIFTNLSMIEDDEETKATWFPNLKKLMPAAHVFSKIFVATWLHHNDLLVEFLKSTRTTVETFPFLDIKKMASAFADDWELFNATLRSMTDYMTTKTTKIGFTSSTTYLDRSHLDRNGDEMDFFEAVMMTAGPFASIKECTPRNAVHFKADPRNVCRSLKERIAVLSMGQEHSEHVVLQSPQVDDVRSTTEKTVKDYYKKQAFVSAVARFMAKEYNDKYRPDGCAAIRFVQGRVLVQKSEVGERCFFAEDYIDRNSLTNFCGSWGEWNESNVDETLLRFVQTTFKLSGGDLMLVGLHGIFDKRDDTFILTTPILLSKMGSSAFTAEIKKLNDECIGAYMSTCRKRTKELLKERFAKEVPARSNDTEKKKSAMTSVLGFTLKLRL